MPLAAQRKRALFIVPVDRAGGAERVTSMMADLLSSDPSWDVEIFILSREPRDFFSRKETNAKLVYGKGNGKFGAELEVLPRIVRQTYDLVYSSTTRINAFLSLARRLRILRCRRLVTRESTVLIDRYSGLRFLPYRVLYSLYGAQNLIIAQTKYMRGRILDLLAPRARSKIRVQLNPVDAVEIQAAVSSPCEAPLRERLDQRANIVWCGRMIEVKQPHIAVETLRILRQEMEFDIGLTMIGMGPLLTQVRDQVRSSGLSEYVTFVPATDNPFKIMTRCRFGLLTSSREGFPNVLLEMMAAGVPYIVTTPCAGDLDTLKGVDVCDAEPAKLAKFIAAGLIGCESRAAMYQAVFRERAPEQFLASILGD